MDLPEGKYITKNHSVHYFELQIHHHTSGNNIHKGHLKKVNPHGAPALKQLPPLLLRLLMNSREDLSRQLIYTKI